LFVILDTLIKDVLRFNCIGNLRTRCVIFPILYFLNLVVVLKILNLYLLKVVNAFDTFKIVSWFSKEVKFIYDHFRTIRFVNLIRLIKIRFYLEVV
jgi:hypothetical protein